MNGYGSHTFSLVNGENERVYAKFHCKADQKIKNFEDAAARATLFDEVRSASYLNRFIRMGFLRL
ncbi:MAG: catalase, partial [Saprospiraceae bacterium]